jgi:hypothetical protein
MKAKMISGVQLDFALVSNAFKKTRAKTAN